MFATAPTPARGLARRLLWVLPMFDFTLPSPLPLLCLPRRRGAAASLLGVAALTTACLEHPVKAVELDSEVSTGDRFDVFDKRNVDILFVVDNSGSMAEEQANLAANFGPMIEELEQARANYRIGITTTDNGNPWCGTTSPEGGAFVYESCLDRLEHFVTQAGTVDARDVACRDRCAYTSEQLGVDAAAPPWLASDEGRVNLPAGVDPADAFACLAPQGLDGCGFESPLEAMYKALLRAGTTGESQQGFLRDDAHLVVLFVTDEADCSHRPEWAEIFDAGNSTFWSPGSSFPNSSICWNAGVRCEGGDCRAQDHDADGLAIDPDDPRVASDAVLFPVERYTDLLESIREDRAAKKLTVSVYGIAGVTTDGTANYEGAADPSFERDFGVAPGCTADLAGVVPCSTDGDCVGVGTGTCGAGGTCIETQTAVPPVRLLEVTRAFDGRAFTVCSDDYRPAFSSIASRVVQEIEPSCVPGCVEDSDPTTPLLDPTCVIELELDATTSVRLPECERDELGYAIDPATGNFVIPDDGSPACYALLADDAGHTPSTTDDIDPRCLEAGRDLEVKIARRPGVELPAGTELSGQCTSDPLGIHCG